MSEAEILAHKIKGKVVARREQNLYHDSYFYTTYWDEETQSFVEYEYASTAYGGGLPGGVVDAPEELMAAYRLFLADRCEKERVASKRFREGEVLIIAEGRKMLGETKVLDHIFRYTVAGTYGHKYTDYAVFKDGTKVNLQHCEPAAAQEEPAGC